MSRQWMFPVCVFLGLVALGIFGSGQNLSKLDLWLDQQDVPTTAQANALSPVIDCINRVDVHWRVAYHLYQLPGRPKASVEEWIANREAFDDDGAKDVRFLMRDICSGKIARKLYLLELAPLLREKTERYVGALYAVSPLAEQAGLFPQSLLSAPAPAMPAAFEAQFRATADVYLSASKDLRHQVETLDLEQRRAQLNVLEARLGKDIHWYLLDYMIQARDTLNRVSEGVKYQTLTPQKLAQTTQALQRAWDYRQQFKHAQLPEQEQRTRVASYLWYHIEKPSQQYLDALNTLQKDWQDHAEPQRLSDDYYAVTRGYDALLSYYNRMARVDY
jgi:hypothetical protein